MSERASEPAPDGADRGPLRPQPEPGCAGELAWRLELPAGTDLAPRIAGFIELGYRVRCMDEVLQVLRHPEGHELVLVPRTGRVQLRVYARTPRQDRARAMLGLADDLAAVLSR